MTVLENVVVGAFVGAKTDDEAGQLAMDALGASAWLTRKRTCWPAASPPSNFA